MNFLNPYDKDLDLSNKDDKDMYLSAIKPRKGEDVYDLTNGKFESFTTKISRKVKEFCLNRGDNFSAKINKNGTSANKMITNCYGEITLADLKTQVETVWVDTANPGQVKTDKDTVLRHMSFQVIANLLTDSAMTQMMSRDNEFSVNGYHNPVLFFKAVVERVKPSC
jgi:hypothetical protein